ncbi:MAG: pilus assembly protein N-terminal domain-containing protein [Bryobacteraceae bacterium]
MRTTIAMIEKLNIQRIACASLLALVTMLPLAAQSAEELRLTVGKSVVIDYPADIRQISTSNPEIIDASPISTREVLMHGKGLGNATMVVWTKSGDRMFYNVTVEMNTDPLRKILKDSFPSETIGIESSRDSLTLNGKVSTKDVADRASALAATFAKTVVNNLQIAAGTAEKQILLRVRFAELDRQKAQQFGVNLLGQLGQTTLTAGTGQFGSTNVQSGAGGGAGQGPLTVTIPTALNILAFDPKLNLGAFLKALEGSSILQILAEPNLVTTNGKEAYFLVGGEFPVPMIQGGATTGAITVQFREFGVRLRFTPVISDHGTIKLHLAQEVSTIDLANAVTLNGFSIPALSTRRAETEVELGEGQSFVVAGLLDNRETEALSSLPVLSSMPILGHLFKSRSINKQSTDLILVVTPEVTMPLNANDPKPEIYFPKDFLVRLEPGDVAQGTKNAKSANKKN